MRKHLSVCPHKKRVGLRDHMWVNPEQTFLHPPRLVRHPGEPEYAPAKMVIYASTGVQLQRFSHMNQRLVMVTVCP